MRSLSTFFRIFQKIEFLLVWRPFLGQNLPQISYFHKIGRGFTSGRNKKGYLAQNGVTRCVLRDGQEYFAEIHILNAQNRLINFELLRICVLAVYRLILDRFML